MTDETTARRDSATIDALEARLDRLSMLCCAMWTVIQAHTNVEDEELLRLVSELDLADGYLDGKAQELQVHGCRDCGRPVTVRHQRCQYCGAPRRPAHPFEGVL